MADHVHYVPLMYELFNDMTLSAVCPHQVAAAATKMGSSGTC